MHFSEKFNSFCLTLYGVRYLIMRFFCLTEYGSEKFERFACSKSGREGANARLLSDCGEKELFFSWRARCFNFSLAAERPRCRAQGRSGRRSRAQGCLGCVFEAFTTQGSRLLEGPSTYLPICTFLWLQFPEFSQSSSCSSNPACGRAGVRACARVCARVLSLFSGNVDKIH